jgi:hypothetical protein
MENIIVLAQKRKKIVACLHVFHSAKCKHAPTRCRVGPSQQKARAAATREPTEPVPPASSLPRRLHLAHSLRRPPSFHSPRKEEGTHACT